MQAMGNDETMRALERSLAYVNAASYLEGATILETSTT
jgi:hypothetical protein